MLCIWPYSMNGKDNANDDDADDTNDYDCMMMMQFENTATTAIGIALVAPRRSESPWWMNYNANGGDDTYVYDDRSDDSGDYDYDDDGSHNGLM